MSVTADTLLLVQLKDYINQHLPDIPLPVPVYYEVHTTAGLQLWLQPLGGTVRVRQYTDGGYVGQIPFAVYSQISGGQAGLNELDPPLFNLAAFLERTQYNFGGVVAVQLTSTPRPHYRDQNGVAINQAIYVLEYLG